MVKVGPQEARAHYIFGMEGVLKTFLSVQCVDAVLNTTLVIVIWENYKKKLSYVVITVY